MKLFQPFFLLLLALSAILLWILNSGWVETTPSYAWEIVVLLAVTTGFIFIYLLNWNKKRPDLFTQFYLLSIAVKIMAYGAFVAFMVISDPTSAIENVVLFLITYVLFTLLEVFFLFRKISES